MDSNSSEFQESTYKYNWLVDNQSETEPFFDIVKNKQMSENGESQPSLLYEDIQRDILVETNSIAEKSEIGSSISKPTNCPSSVKKRDHKQVVKSMPSKENNKEPEHTKKLKLRKMQNRVAAQK